MGRIAIRNAGALCAVLLTVCLLHAGAMAQAEGQGQAVADGPPFPGAIRPDERQASLLPITRTDSPRQTLTSFMRLRDALEKALGDYGQNNSIENAYRVGLVADEMRTLFDFSAVPSAARRETGVETGAYVLDVLGRVGLPNLDTVPDLAEAEAGDLKHFAVPETPFRILRIDDGPQAGEFLFSSETVLTAPRFFSGIKSLPLQSSLGIKSWIEEARQLTGPIFPAALVLAVPEALKRPILGTPIWKILCAGIVFALGALVFLGLHWLVTPRSAGGRPRFWRRALSPLSILLITTTAYGFVTYQINVAGRFAVGVDVLATVIAYLAVAWAVWLLTLALFEHLVRRRGSAEGNLDANMLRLLARIVGIIGVIIVLASGAQEMGLPVVSVLAGLGIGGLAVALAIRPTLENLIGGFILYLDKPIRVGDFCTFGGQSGTVESIGVRSTQVRALDRTLVAIPNAQFADMQIINWAACDQMMIEQTISLRYETGADQLRHVLAKIREMFHGHPRIDSDTIRVRFSTYGLSSLDILIRVYARTREWNDFFAVKEDVLFRIKEIVEKSGTGFAFPSQTLYLGHDPGLDAKAGEESQQEVALWRRTGQLPFPRFAAGALERLSGRLHYPPRGSPDFHATEEELAQAGDERLSAEPLPRDAATEPAVPETGDPERK